MPFPRLYADSIPPLPSSRENGNKMFITKGDHNNTIDATEVAMEDVIGKVSFVIPYIGYPSVWLSGAIS